MAKDLFGTDREVWFDARYAFLLSRFLGDENRHYLTGVYSEPFQGGVLLVATDGHRMGLVFDPAGHSNGVWINPLPDGLAAVCDVRSWRGNLVFHGRTASLVPDGAGLDDMGGGGDPAVARFGAAPIESDYPDFRRVLPKVWPDTVRQFRSQYLASFSTAEICLLPHDDLLDPAYVTVPGEPQFVGVLMPMRQSKSEKPRPGWLADLVTLEG